MSRNQLTLAAGAIAFVVGMFAQAYRGNTLAVASPAESNSTHQVASNTQSCDCADKKLSRLTNDEFITKFNGDKLNVLWSSWEEDPGGVPYLIESAEVQPIGQKDVLVKYADAVYRLNKARQIVWEYRTAQMVFDIEYVKSTNLVYLTAGDNIMAILNGDTGDKLHSSSRNGSAAFGVTGTYQDDICVVTDNFRAYREKGRTLGVDPMNDGITAWRGTKELWHMEFPPGAELVLGDQRILAVTKSNKAIYVKEITPNAAAPRHEN